jgi:hypothetical protein
VGAVESEVAQQVGDHARERSRPRRRARRRARGAPEARQIDGDDVSVRCQEPEDGLPHLPAAPDSVDEDQRLARPLAVVVDRRGHARTLSLGAALARMDNARYKMAPKRTGSR